MNDPLNTNTRILRSSPDGFTVTSGVICGSCGVREICKPAHPPAVCNDFSPLLVFRSPLIGFDGSFNTFRLGRGMFERLKDRAGTVATLYEKRRGRILGHAVIKGVACGPLDKMLAEYAHSNHLSIGRKITLGAAPGWLQVVLHKNYKTMFKTADKNDLFTVIFMERCEAPRHERYRRPAAQEAA